MPATASADVACTNDELIADNTSPANLAAVETALLCLVNAHRQAHGLPRLARDTNLDEAARAHSVDMNTRDFFAHNSPDPGGTTPTQRAAAAGYTTGNVGENIAMTGGFPPDPRMYGTAWSLFEEWRTSTLGHNEQMLNAAWVATGHGVDTPCWCSGLDYPGVMGTQMFGSAPADTTDTGPYNFAPLPAPKTTEPPAAAPSPSTGRKRKKCRKGFRPKKVRGKRKCVRRKKK